MNLIKLGNCTLSSGKKSDWKLVADDFIRDNLDGLVHLIQKVVGPFSSVEGIPTGGTILADALQPYVVVGPGRIAEALPHLIVDDVLTTGRSMEKAADCFIKGKTARIEGPLVRGCVVFARGPCPLWVKVLFQLPEALWLEGKQ